MALGSSLWCNHSLLYWAHHSFVSSANVRWLWLCANNVLVSGNMKSPLHEWAGLVRVQSQSNRILLPGTESILPCPLSQVKYWTFAIVLMIQLRSQDNRSLASVLKNQLQSNDPQTAVWSGVITEPRKLVYQLSLLTNHAHCLLLSAPTFSPSAVSDRSISGRPHRWGKSLNHCTTVPSTLKCWKNSVSLTGLLGGLNKNISINV